MVKLKEIVHILSDISDRPQLKVAIPLIPKAMNDIVNILIPTLNTLGIPYFLQKMKIRNHTGAIEVMNYDNVEEKTRQKVELLLDEVEDGGRGVLAKNYQGKKCFAGMKMITILEDGQVYRCFNFAECKSLTGHLGNISGGYITLAKASIICPFEICGCGAAAYRNLIID